MCSSESTYSPAPHPLQTNMTQHMNSQIILMSETKSKHIETIVRSDSSEVRLRSPRLSPLIRQRASFYESPQERSRAVVAMFVDEQENDALIEISDDSDSEGGDCVSRPVAVRCSSRDSIMSTSIKSRISMFESPKRSSPQKSASDSPSRRNGFIKTKAKLFEMMKSPGKLIANVGGRIRGKKRANEEKRTTNEIDVEEKVRDVDELFDLYQKKTGKSPGLLGSMREKVKKSHRAHFLQISKEQKREMAVKEYKEGLEKDKLERKRVTIQVPNEDDDEADNEDIVVESYRPSSMTSAGLPLEQLRRRRSVARSVHVAVDLPEDYMQSKKHAKLIAACKQEYRCKSLDLPMDTEFPPTYSETVRKEATSTSTVKPLKAKTPRNWFGCLQNQLHKRLSSVMVEEEEEEEKTVPMNKYVRPQGLHFDWSLPPDNFNTKNFGNNEVKMSESSCRLFDNDEDSKDETLLPPRDDLPTLRRLPSIRRLPTPSTSASTTSSSESETSLDNVKLARKSSKKEGDDKSKKDKKDKTTKEETTEKKKDKKTSSKGEKEEKVKVVKSKSCSSKSSSKREQEEKGKVVKTKSSSSKKSEKEKPVKTKSSSSKKDEKEKPVKTKSSSSKSSSSKKEKSKKDKKKKSKEVEEEKNKVKKPISFAESPVADFEMTAMVRKLQDAREAAKNILETVTDASPRKPQRRPSLASCSDVGLELCQQLRPREAYHI